MQGKMDFAALMKLQTCAVCGKPITGKMLKAFNKVFHDTCLVCHVCKKPLGAGYQMDETRKPGQEELDRHKPHCPECYTRLYMPVCKSCGKNIGEPLYVQACGGSWHEKCFQCATCRQVLAAETKHWPVDDKPYCQKHYWEARLKSQAAAKSTPTPNQPQAQTKSMVGKSFVGQPQPSGKTFRPPPPQPKSAPKSLAPKAIAPRAKTGG